MFKISVVLTSLVFIVGNPALAQFGPNRVPPVPIGRAIGMNDQINGILTKMLKAYRELKTYQDQGRVAVRQTTGRVRQTTEMPSTLKFQRPNQIQLIGGGQTIGSDGKTLQLVLDGFGQYTSNPAPLQLTMEHLKLAAPGGGLDQGYPEVLEFLVGENVYPRWKRQIKSITIDEKSPKIGARKCDVIHYESVYKAKVTMFIDKETSMLLLCNMDITHAQQGSGPGEQRPGGNPMVEIQYQLFPARVNQTIDANEFTVKKPIGMRLVRDFQAPNVAETGELMAPDVTPAAPKSKLLGKALPKFSAADLDGKKFDSADLKDKVTVVFFWSPTGGPECLQAIQMFERLKNSFKQDANIEFLSISGLANQPAKIEELLIAKKATYRTIPDVDSRLFAAFNVPDVPAFFISSKDGIVRHVATGAPSEREEELIKQIELAKSVKLSEK